MDTTDVLILLLGVVVGYYVVAHYGAAGRAA